MIRFDDLTILMLAMDNGSLSAAAHVLNVAPTAASATVKRLEAELGVRLLVRSTCSLALTQEGERYLQHACRALADLRAEQDALALGRQAISGNMSLLILSDLGHSMLAGWLDDFPTGHPAVALRVRIDDWLVDMFRQRVDAAARYDKPKDSFLVTLPLAPNNHRVLCTAPAYFAWHGAPKAPGDLRQYNCLLLALSDITHDQWTSHGTSDDGQTRVVRVTGSHIAGDGRLVRRWAVAGHGIVYKSRLDVLADLRAGWLQTALIDWHDEVAPLHLICTHRLALSPAPMRLRDFPQECTAGYLADA